MELDLYFLPHGPQIIAGLEDPFNEKFRETSEAMLKIKNIFESKNYAAVILVTPHGYHLDNGYLVFSHSQFNGDYYKIQKGNSVEFEELAERKRWTGNPELNKQLFSFLQASGVKTEELVQGFEGYPLTLAWGEVVPLYFSMKEETKLTILGVPRSRHEGIFDIQSELKKISILLISLIRSKTEKICLIFSGDLSHTHDPDGPYGYHDTSKPFDSLIQEWAREPNRETFEEFLELQPTALACGMAGMSILQGIFDNYQSTTQSVHYSLPTYFGMMTAHWSIELN